MMDKMQQWDENLVLHDGVEHRLDEMTPAELYSLGELLRAAVAGIEEQLNSRIIRTDADEDWNRRARSALGIKRRQVEHIDDLLTAGKRAAPPRPELSMSQALAQVVGRGGRPEDRPVPRPPQPVTRGQNPAAATYFVMAARVVLHPAMFAAIEEQAARLAEAGQ